MINPNICKRVKVLVQPATVSSFGKANQTALLNGRTLDIVYRKNQKIKAPGSRYLYLQYSIMTESYYLRTF